MSPDPDGVIGSKDDLDDLPAASSLTENPTTTDLREQIKDALRIYYKAILSTRKNVPETIAITDFDPELFADGFSLCHFLLGVADLWEKEKNQLAGARLIMVCSPKSRLNDPDFVLEDGERLLPARDVTANSLSKLADSEHENIIFVDIEGLEQKTVRGVAEAIDTVRGVFSRRLEEPFPISIVATGKVYKVLAGTEEQSLRTDKRFLVINLQQKVGNNLQLKINSDLEKYLPSD